MKLSPLLLILLTSLFLKLGGDLSAENRSERLSLSNSKKETILVVSSIPPLASIALELGGEMVNAHPLVTMNVDPHQFELKPSAITKLEKAQVVLFVGGKFEFWSKGLDTSIQDKLISIDSFISPDKKIRNNFHYWLDPELMIPFINKLSSTFVKIDPDNKEAYNANREALLSKISNVTEKISSEIVFWRYKSYFCSHPAWSYFAKRFGLREIGCLKTDHLHETNSKTLSQLSLEASDPLNRIFFLQVNESLNSAQSFISDNNLKPVILDDLGDIKTSYVDLLMKNISLMSEVMK